MDDENDPVFGDLAVAAGVMAAIGIGVALWALLYVAVKVLG